MNQRNIEIEKRNDLLIKIEELKKELFYTAGHKAVMSNPCVLLKWKDLVNQLREFNNCIDKDDRVVSAVVYSQQELLKGISYVTCYYLRLFTKNDAVDVEVRKLMRSKKKSLVECVEF